MSEEPGAYTRRSFEDIVDIDPTQTTASLAIGALFRGRYEVARSIKAGGMGAVYEVIDVETKRRRALKVMHPGLLEDPKLWDRFKLEATITATVRSEHIVDVLDAGVDTQTSLPFLVMELLDGQDLSTRLRQGRRIPVEEALPLLRQAAAALDKTHAAGIIHRDLKPANLFITKRDDGSPRLVIVDFGIARIVSLTRGTPEHTTGIGTPMYMAPEQIRGGRSIGPGADLYSLALIAYSVLVGRAYWKKAAHEATSDFQLVLIIAEGPKEAATVRAAESGVELPPVFDAWFARATALQPEDRFPTASALIEALGVVLVSGSGVVDIAPVGQPERRGPASSEEAGAASSPGSNEPSRPSDARTPGAASSNTTAVPLSDVQVAPRKGRAVVPMVTFGVGVVLAVGGLALRAQLADSSPGPAVATANVAVHDAVPARADAIPAPGAAAAPVVVAAAASSSPSVEASGAQAPSPVRPLPSSRSLGPSTRQAAPAPSPVAPKAAPSPPTSLPSVPD